MPAKKKTEALISDYTEGIAITDSSSIDFAHARQIKAGGTICDTFVARQGQRNVFIKKLKSKFSTSPIHIEALKKEFQVGTMLRHNSLPFYIDAKDDYIVMDYVDGHTLADMIGRNDLWLHQRRNIIRILDQLLSVVDYLHQNNVVHCDIKADNIIITSGTRNVVLIDLDKCYTSYLDSTSGSPSLYGVSAKKLGDPQIDFHGIARIAEKLSVFFSSDEDKARIAKFVKVCNSDNPYFDELSDILHKQMKKSPLTPAINKIGKWYRLHIKKIRFSDTQKDDFKGCLIRTAFWGALFAICIASAIMCDRCSDDYVSRDEIEAHIQPFIAPVNVIADSLNNVYDTISHNVEADNIRNYNLLYDAYATANDSVIKLHERYPAEKQERARDRVIHSSSWGEFLEKSNATLKRIKEFDSTTQE